MPAIPLGDLLPDITLEDLENPFGDLLPGNFPFTDSNLRMKKLLLGDGVRAEPEDLGSTEGLDEPKKDAARPDPETVNRRIPKRVLDVVEG